MLQQVIGPSKCLCEQTQRLRLFQGDHLVLETSQIMSQIPYGDHFKVETRWDITPDQGGRACEVLIISCQHYVLLHHVLAVLYRDSSQWHYCGPPPLQGWEPHVRSFVTRWLHCLQQAVTSIARLPTWAKCGTDSRNMCYCSWPRIWQSPSRRRPSGRVPLRNRHRSPSQGRCRTGCAQPSAGWSRLCRCRLAPPSPAASQLRATYVLAARQALQTPHRLLRKERQQSLQEAF